MIMDFPIQYVFYADIVMHWTYNVLKHTIMAWLYLFFFGINSAAEAQKVNKDFSMEVLLLTLMYLYCRNMEGQKVWGVFLET